MVVVFPLPEEKGRTEVGRADRGRGKRTARVTQPLPSLAEAPRGSFHPPDDDLTRTTEGSFPPSLSLSQQQQFRAYGVRGSENLSFFLSMSHSEA